MTVKRPLVRNQQISKLVRELRLSTVLIQEQFATELGVTCSSINLWENRGLLKLEWHYLHPLETEDCYTWQ